MSVVVSSMREMKGKFLRDGAVEILEEPFFDDKLQKWCALANAWGCISFIELSVKPATGFAIELPPEM